MAKASPIAAKPTPKRPVETLPSNLFVLNFSWTRSAMPSVYPRRSALGAARIIHRCMLGALKRHSVQPVLAGKSTSGQMAQARGKRLAPPQKTAPLCYDP